MNTKLKYLKEGCVSRFKEAYQKIRKTDLTNDQRKEILDIVKKDEDKNKPKRIAQTERDAEV